MDRQNAMISIAKQLDKKSIFIYTEDSLLEFYPYDTRITFDKDYLGLKTLYSDVTVKYDSIQAIEFGNR